MNKITILGAGNVGSHLSIAFSQAGHEVVLWNRTPHKSAEIANNHRVSQLAHISHIEQSTDMVIICVNENAIDHICTEIPPFNGILVHTAGSVHVEALQKFSHKHGVIYPLQTFTSNRSLTYHNIPLFIEGSSKEVEKHLAHICSSVFRNIQYINSVQRAHLHLAAVFACNFVNASLMGAQEIAENNNLNFRIFDALIHETIDKLKVSDPHENQTGPAIRNNTIIIKKHKELLCKHKHLRKVYKWMSQYITHKFQS
jgi:predicted short-subunit dehydrogenase-like oxidoreductase (DUF2520 family)